MAVACSSLTLPETSANSLPSHHDGDSAVANVAHASGTDSTLVETGIAEIVRSGLTRKVKQLPPWLFYDEAGSNLFDQITCLPEYYLTRIERALFEEHAGEMITAAAEGETLRVIELGAGSADKTRTLLAAALDQQGTVHYLPVDVSPSALQGACERLEGELPAVRTTPVVADYTRGWELPESNEPQNESRHLTKRERQLLLWIGSSIGNFEPHEAEALLRRIHAMMQPGDSLLLGVDMAPSEGGKCVGELLAAYDDEAGVTAQFNMNLLVRLNRELGANFDTEAFAHWAEWNAQDSRMEMHLESLRDQWVRLQALDLDVHFAAGERLHTENSYKYTPETAAALMERAGFPVCERWTDEGEWFAVMLGRRS